jgi:hypothetical protein
VAPAASPNVVCLEGCPVLLFIARDGCSAELRSRCRTQHESSRGRDDYPNRRAGDVLRDRRARAVQSLRPSRQLSAVAWLGHRSFEQRARCGPDGTERMSRLAGRGEIAVAGRPSRHRGARSGHLADCDGLAEQQRKGARSWPERTSEARTLADLQFKLNPSGSGNPAPVSHLSGEATNPIAILLQRCLARIWPKFVGLIRRNSNVSRNMASHRRSGRQ